MADTGRDSSTLDSGDRTMLEAAIRAVCTRLNECLPSDIPDVEECVGDYLRDLSSYPPACADALGAYYACIYTPECSVILDDAMLETHVETHCVDEEAAANEICSEL